MPQRSAAPVIITRRGVSACGICWSIKAATRRSSVFFRPVPSTIGVLWTKRTILCHRVQRVPALVDHQAQVSAAHAKGVHLAVQRFVQLGGFFHVAVGAAALDAHPLAQQVTSTDLLRLEEPRLMLTARFMPIVLRTTVDEDRGFYAVFGEKE